MKYKLIRLIITVVMCYPLLSKGQSQKNSDTLVTTLYVITKQIDTSKTPISNEGYLAMVKVTNPGDSIVNFPIMSCSWMSSNFASNNKEISLSYLQCDINTEEIINLQPQKSIYFYFIIKSQKKILINSKFKIGFLYFPNASEFLNYRIGNTKGENQKIFWSNEVELKDNLNKYQRD